jgi:hypothetical protein
MSEIPLLRNLIKLSGVSLSTGLYYSAFSGREDIIGNGYYSDIGNLTQPEVVVVDRNTKGTVTVGAPSSSYYKSYVYYPYVEFQHLSIHSDIKAYINVLYFLDIFLGTGVVITPYSKFYSDISSNINIRISDNQGLDNNYDGRYTIIGTVNGSHLQQMFILGFQLNFGPVKIPIQISNSIPTKNRVSTLGLYIYL